MSLLLNERFGLDLNQRMRDLQSLALPLGYRTIILLSHRNMYALTSFTTHSCEIIYSFGSHECEEFLLSQSVAVANLCVPVTLFTQAHENLKENLLILSIFLLLPTDDWHSHQI